MACTYEGWESCTNYGNDDVLMNYNDHLMHSEDNDDKGAKYKKLKQ